VVDNFKAWRVARIKQKSHSREARSLPLDAAILHRVFSYDVELEMIVRNPVRLEGRPGEAPECDAQPFKAEELSKLSAAAGLDSLAFLLLRWTGFAWFRCSHTPLGRSGFPNRRDQPCHAEASKAGSRSIVAKAWKRCQVRTPIHGNEKNESNEELAVGLISLVWVSPKPAVGIRRGCTEPAKSWRVPVTNW